ncbi:hypothetical protein TIFTF001_019378 [Ficus carica]|uniref:Uncharacterized protein n=1 Tax=Ficus carica TaxID=3494 RepID=A0AA88DJE3_FICCA|nr:hypothetical protein TIFTF001_019378 [Ficus carica]
MSSSSLDGGLIWSELLLGQIEGGADVGGRCGIPMAIAVRSFNDDRGGT